MRLLVTAGNTQTPIDDVRCITNIFTGRTGTRLALDAHHRGHEVTLLTSHPEVVMDLAGTQTLGTSRWQVLAYRTFADLSLLMEQHIQTAPGQPSFHVIIHVAAVSDYQVTHILAPKEPPLTTPGAGLLDRFMDVRAGKVKSQYPELWLRLVRTPKLVDKIRSEWGFRGLLVKFKLEVGLTESVLAEVAEASRLQSQADLMVANTLEGKNAWALIGPSTDGSYARVNRDRLSSRLLDILEQRQRDHHT